MMYSNKLLHKAFMILTAIGSDGMAVKLCGR